MYLLCVCCFYVKQKTAYDMRISDWSSDVCSSDLAFDLRTVTRLQQLKTGALLAAAVEMGAILGRVPPEGRAHLRAYARDIGLAFQIADDLLDHAGDPARAGKAEIGSAHV